MNNTSTPPPEDDLDSLMKEVPDHDPLQKVASCMAVLDLRAKYGLGERRFRHVIVEIDGKQHHAIGHVAFVGTICVSPVPIDGCRIQHATFEALVTLLNSPFAHESGVVQVLSNLMIARNGVIDERESRMRRQGTKNQ